MSAAAAFPFRASFRSVRARSRPRSERTRARCCSSPSFYSFRKFACRYRESMASRIVALPSDAPIGRANCLWRTVLRTWTRVSSRRRAIGRDDVHDSKREVRLASCGDSIGISVSTKERRSETIGKNSHPLDTFDLVCRRKLRARPRFLRGCASSRFMRRLIS